MATVDFEDGFIFSGWQGWRPSKAHAAIVEQQLKRLVDTFNPHGIRVTADVYVARATVGDLAIAILHIYFNGADVGLPWKKEGGLGLRIYADEIGMPDIVSPGPCVKALAEQLPARVDDLIAHEEEIVKAYT